MNWFTDDGAPMESIKASGMPQLQVHTINRLSLSVCLMFKSLTVLKNNEFVLGLFIIIILSHGGDHFGISRLIHLFETVKSFERNKENILTSIGIL